MQAIEIPKAVVDKHAGRSKLVEEYVKHGHEPGTLSNAKLKGRAREYGGFYDSMARRAATAVQEATGRRVDSRLVLHPDNRRWSRVWATEDGEPVRIEIK